MDARENAGRIPCEYASREDVDAAYLAGRLEPAETEAFEEHYFACDACWNRVQRALELRRAFSAPRAPREHGTGTAGSQGRVARWWPLAAAAALGSIAFGLLWLQTPAPVFRSAEQPAGFDVEVEADAGELRVRWAPVPGAAGYEIRTLASDGRVLRRMEIATPVVTLDSGAAATAAAPVLVEVVALDELGQVLRRSRRVALTE